MVLRAARVALLTVCVLSISSGAFVGAPSVAEAAEVRIAVLFRNSEAGGRFRDGTQEALEKYAGKHELKLEPTPYEDEKDGKTQLLQLIADRSSDDRSIRNKAPHLVLGPTDSGVFTEAVEDADAKTQRLPVISAVVTARKGNTSGGWFFRANVDAGERARTIYKVLSASGFETTVVLYADTAFGREAEAAFRGELLDEEKAQFRSVRYQDPRDTLGAIRQIFGTRPGAVGIFGSRPEIAEIASEITDRNSEINPYTPMLFSIVDARVLELPDLHFVSVVQGERALSIAQAEEDDIKSLAFDTAALVFGNIDRVSASPDSDSWAGAFRRRMQSVWAGPPSKRRGARTGMYFDRFENRADAEVFVLEDGKFAALGPPVASKWYSGLTNWFAVRYRRFGLAPVFNIALIIAIAGGMSLVDLRRWNKNRSRYVGFSPPFVMFVLFNCGVAIAIFAFLSETGRASWNNTLGAIGVALGYAALLKTTLFQNEEGDEFGLAKWYGRIVQWINDQIMVEKWRSESPKVNYIAFRNNLEYLESRIREVYGYGPDGDVEDERLKQLDREEKAAKTLLQKRQVYARRALAMMRWNALQERGLVRSDLEEKDVLDMEAVIQLAAEYSMNCREFTVRNLRTFVLKRIEEDGGELGKAEVELKHELENAYSRQAKFASMLRYLTMANGYGASDLFDRDLLPKDYRKQLRRRGSWFRRLRRRGAPKRTTVGGLEPTFTEGRSSERAPLRARTRLRRVGDAGAPWLGATMRNLGRGGAGVVVLESEGDGLGIDAPVEVKMRGKEQEAIVQGVVRHEQRGLDTVLWGIQFNELPDDVREGIDILIGGKEGPGAEASQTPPPPA